MFTRTLVTPLSLLHAVIKRCFPSLSDCEERVLERYAIKVVLVQVHEIGASGRKMRYLHTYLEV